MKEAQCPYCLDWFALEWVPIPPGGWWWRDSGVCPGCSTPVLVESECEFREVKSVFGVSFVDQLSRRLKRIRCWFGIHAWDAKCMGIRRCADCHRQKRGRW